MPLLTPTPYATLTDVYNSGLQQAAAGTMTQPQQQSILDASNAKIDSYIGAKFTLPLVSWGADLQNAACVLTAYGIIAFRGFDPEDPGDQVFKERRDHVTKWLEMIAKGEATPVVVDSLSGGKGGAGGNNFTTQSRTQFNTPQAQLDGQVTVNSDSQGGQVVISRPTSRGWY